MVFENPSFVFTCFPDGDVRYWLGPSRRPNHLVGKQHRKHGEISGKQLFQRRENFVLILYEDPAFDPFDEF